MENIVMPRLGKIAKRETLIRGENVVIIVPDTESGKKFGTNVMEKVKNTASSVRVEAGKDESLFKESGVFIVCGNLTDNDCVKYLYFKSLVITDLCYPGPGGYEVRTVINPFGNDKNILFIGYSDEEGFQKGAEGFLEAIDGKDSVPFLKTVHYTRLPVTDQTFERLHNSKEPDNISLLPSAHVNNWYMKAWLAFATGEQHYADDYIRAWTKLLTYAEQIPDKPGLDSSTCIGMCAHTGSFWLAVHSGIIPEDLQEKIETLLYRWMCSNFGVDYAKPYKNTSTPPHNIVMFVALACTYLTEYFIKTYGTNETLDYVAEIARKPFIYFASGNWRPYCDDSSYTLGVSLPLAIAHSLFEDNHTFIKTSFKEAKPYIMAMHMPSGFIPSIGDGGVARLASQVCLTYAYLYRDGQIQAMLDAEPNRSHLDLTGFTLPMRAFCGLPVKPEPIDQDDLQVLPLNRWHYEASVEKSEEGKRVPYEKAYDKISLRKFTKSCKGCDLSCKTDWDYLLIDGLGIETHCKNNTLAILDLSINGISCFVEESGYRWPDRESCSTVTISRNGYSGFTPELASLDKLEQTDETLYIKSTVPGFNGVDWTRELFLVYGSGAVIHDTFTAYQADDYVFYNHMRIPAKMETDKNAVFGYRYAGQCDPLIQRVETYAADDVGVSVETVDIGAKKFENGDMGEPWYKKPEGPDAMDMWMQRYGSDNAVITKYTTFISSKMKEKDSVSYTHLLQICEPDCDIAYFDRDDESSYVIFPTGDGEGIEYELPFTPALFSDKEISSVNSSEKAELISFKPWLEFKGPAKGYAVTEKGCLLTYHGDKISYYDEKGFLNFEKSFPKGVRSVAAMDLTDKDNLLAVGYDDKNICVMNTEGDMLWETVVVRQPTMLCGWETKHPKVFSLCFVKAGESYRLIAGCGDNHVKLYDDQGKLITGIFADYRIIDHLIPKDYDQDGQTEVLAYASDEASSGNFYFYDNSLKVKYRESGGGWLYTVKDVGVAVKGDKTYIAVGVNTNQTLSVFELFGGKLTRIYTKAMAGANTAVCIDATSGVVYAGSDKGYIKAFDLKGEEIASCYTGMSVKRIVLHEGGLYAFSNREMKKTDLKLNLTSVGVLPSDLLNVEQKDNKLLIVCSTGIYAMD